MYIYEIVLQDQTIKMILDKRISGKRLKGLAKRHIDELYGPQIYRQGDIVSVGLVEERKTK